MKKEKWIALVVYGILILLLLVFFLWDDYHFKLSRQINSEKFSHFFTCIGSIGAVISLYFLYKQIADLEISRKIANKPQLYIHEKTFFVHDIPGGSSVSNLPTVAPYDNGKGRGDLMAKLELWNVGLGTAIDIIVTWEYDINEINEKIQNEYRPIKETDTKESERFDFLLKEERIFLEIPSLYLLCCGNRVNDQFLDNGEDENGKPKTKFVKPLLQVCLAFKDIQSRLYCKRFNVGVEALLGAVTFKFSYINT